MQVPEDEYLPTYQELKSPEIHVGYPVFKAASLYLGQYCDQQCKEYMLCKAEISDPRACLHEGKEVTRCNLEFFQKVKTNCYDEFTKYWRCIDTAVGMDFSRCRKSQNVFDKCISEKMNIQRPPLGYFSKVRLHESIRAKPIKEVQETAPPEVEVKPDPRLRIYPTAGFSR